MTYNAQRALGLLRLSSGLPALSGRISPDLQAQLGKMLCVWGMLDGADWCAKASIGTAILPMYWLKPVCGWCKSGTRNRRPTG
jgi:hypothetical protein